MKRFIWIGLVGSLLVSCVVMTAGCDKTQGINDTLDKLTANRVTYEVNVDGDLDASFGMGPVFQLGKPMHYSIHGNSPLFPAWTAEELAAQSAARNAAAGKAQDAAIEKAKLTPAAK